MQSDTDQILLQLCEVITGITSTLRDLARNELLLIESVQLEASPATLGAAAATVRSTLYSVDALADRIQTLSRATQRG